MGNALSDNAEIVMGQSPPGETCNTNGVGLPLLNGPTEYGQHHPTPAQYTTDPRKRAKAGDVLFCVRGSTTGRMNWADRDYAIGRGVAAIRHKTRPELQPLVRAVIDYSLPSLLAEATGSTFPNVSASQIGRLWWPDLPEREQLDVARILGALDGKIELNRRMSETLEAIARALFESWFSQHPHVDRAGWEVSTLGDVVELNPPRRLRKGDAAPYIDMASLPTTGHVVERVVRRPFSSGSRFENGDTLVARITPCLENGKTCLVDCLAGEEIGWGSTEFIVMRPRPPLGAEFAYCLARNPEFREYAIQSMTGSSGRQRVPVEALARFELAIPPAEIAIRFTDAVRPLFERAKVASDESSALTDLRDALLPKLISGELRVGDGQRVVEAAT